MYRGKLHNLPCADLHETVTVKVLDVVEPGGTGVYKFFSQTANFHLVNHPLILTLDQAF